MLVSIDWSSTTKVGDPEMLVASGKKPIQAIVDVERKLLHAIHGMWRTNQLFDGSKFYAMNP